MLEIIWLNESQSRAVSASLAGILASAMGKPAESLHATGGSFRFKVGLLLVIVDGGPGAGAVVRKQVTNRPGAQVPIHRPGSAGRQTTLALRDRFWLNPPAMNRHALLGCGGTFAVLVLLAGLFILETSNFIETRSTEGERERAAEEERIRAFETGWQPPSAVLNASWFPPNINDRRRERRESARAIPELEIERTGLYAIYRSPLGVMRVNIIPATEDERATIIAKARSALEKRDSLAQPDATSDRDRGPRRRTTTHDNRTEIRVGGMHTRFWWLKDWLFIFRARGPADSEKFPEEFLRAISQPATAPTGEKIERN